jgi:hypothetical protein
MTGKDRSVLVIDIITVNSLQLLEKGRNFVTVGSPPSVEQEWFDRHDEVPVKDARDV